MKMNSINKKILKPYVSTMNYEEEFSGIDHDDNRTADVDSETVQIYDSDIQYNTKMGLATKLVILDRVLFSFMILPGIFIGLTSGFVMAAVFVVAAITARMVLQFVLRSRIETNMMMPLKLRRESTDIMALFALVSLGISYNEGELFGFVTMAVVIGIAYLAIILICFLKFDEEV